MPCEMGEKFPGPPIPQTYWEDGFRKAAEMFPMQPNERAELETLRSQIASLRALATESERYAGSLRRVAAMQKAKGNSDEATGNEMLASVYVEHANKITAIVGKE